MPIIICITLIVGIIIGAVNGCITSYLKVPAFIATLGTMYVVRGVAMLTSNGTTFPNLVGKKELGNTGFQIPGTENLLGIPVSIWIMLVIAVIAAYFLKNTPLGWHIYAIGGNEKAAEMSGIRVKRNRLLVYMFSGFCAAMVGIIVASQLSSAHPAYGTSWEMNAIASAVLGGTSMAGGIGSIGGTIVGGFVIGVLSDGMVLAGISEFWQLIIKGVVIIAAVIIDQVQRDVQAKLALKQRNG